MINCPFPRFHTDERLTVHCEQQMWMAKHCVIRWSNIYHLEIQTHFQHLTQHKTHRHSAMLSMIEFVRWTIDSSDEFSPSRIPQVASMRNFCRRWRSSRTEFNHGESTEPIGCAEHRQMPSLLISMTRRRPLHASMQRLLERPLSLHHLRRSYQNFPSIACLCALTQKEKQANNTIELFSHRLEYGRISWCSFNIESCYSTPWEALSTEYTVDERRSTLGYWIWSKINRLWIDSNSMSLTEITTGNNNN